MLILSASDGEEMVSSGASELALGEGEALVGSVLVSTWTFSYCGQLQTTNMTSLSVQLRKRYAVYSFEIVQASSSTHILCPISKVRDFPR